VYAKRGQKKRPPRQASFGNRGNIKPRKKKRGGSKEKAGGLPSRPHGLTEKVSNRGANPCKRGNEQQKLVQYYGVMLRWIAGRKTSRGGVGQKESWRTKRKETGENSFNWEMKIQTTKKEPRGIKTTRKGEKTKKERRGATQKGKAKGAQWKKVQFTSAGNRVGGLHREKKAKQKKKVGRGYKITRKNSTDSGGSPERQQIQRALARLRKRPGPSHTNIRGRRAKQKG